MRAEEYQFLLSDVFDEVTDLNDLAWNLTQR